MKKHLWTYVNYFQNNWVDLLPIAKFAANENASATTKIPLFQTTREYVPKMSFDLVNLSEKSTRKWLANSKTRFIAADIGNMGICEEKNGSNSGVAGGGRESAPKRCG